MGRREAFTPAELARAWGTSDDTIRDLIHSGDLDAFNVGKRNKKRWLIPTSAIDEFKQRRRARTQPQRCQRTRKMEMEVQEIVK